MTDPTQLHRQAMELADEAADARRRGLADDCSRLSLEALEKEAAAAMMLEHSYDLEPTRSVLFRSAASLALDIRDFRQAEQLIAAALRGSPPSEIAEELRDLFENANFGRHLAVRGVELQPDEFQMSLDGPAIGFGVARSDYFIRRVRDLETLIYRTAERKLGRAFREAGRRRAKLVEELELYLSTPRAASFAVTFKIGKSEQLRLPGIDFPRYVIDDLLDCIEIINGPTPNELHNRIPDESYFYNFVGLARQLAPDGQAVRSVGFTAGSGVRERRIAFSKPRPQILHEGLHKHPPAVPPSVGRPVQLRGILLEADAKSQETGTIEVVSEDGTTSRIRVPRALMRDIVKPMFEEQVVAQVLAGAQGVYDLESIDLADDDAAA